MTDFEVKQESAYELVSWKIGPVGTDDGRNVIAIYPMFRGPGQPEAAESPPFVLTEEAANKLIEHLTYQLKVLRSMKPSPRGAH